MFGIRISSIESSYKRSAKTREKSPFIAEICQAVDSLPEGQAVFISKDAWLDSLGDKVATMSPGSLKNGPRYTLARLGYEALEGNLSGEELSAQAEAEDRELSDKSVIYRIVKKAE